jgi:hypothetical protein
MPFAAPGWPAERFPPGHRAPVHVEGEIERADDGSRTRDLELGKLALYQLSYVRAESVILRRHTMAPLYASLP